jgi:hypothetical protein
MHEVAQTANVLVLDVAPILAQMHGDAVGAAQMRFNGRRRACRNVATWSMLTPSSIIAMSVRRT